MIFGPSWHRQIWVTLCNAEILFDIITMSYKSGLTANWANFVEYLVDLIQENWCNEA